MVQKYQSPVRVYKYPFELVMAVSLVIILFMIVYLVLPLWQNADRGMRKIDNMQIVMIVSVHFLGSSPEAHLTRASLPNRYSGRAEGL